MVRMKLDKASLGTYVSFIIGAVGIVGELRKPVKDLPSMGFYCGLMGVPVVFPGQGKNGKEK